LCKCERNRCDCNLCNRSALLSGGQTGGFARVRRTRTFGIRE
jgi:hypothetical protein